MVGTRRIGPYWRKGEEVPVAYATDGYTRKAGFRGRSKNADIYDREKPIPITARRSGVLHMPNIIASAFAKDLDNRDAFKHEEANPYELLDSKRHRLSRDYMARKKTFETDEIKAAGLKFDEPKYGLATMQPMFGLEPGIKLNAEDRDFMLSFNNSRKSLIDFENSPASKRNKEIARLSDLEIKKRVLKRRDKVVEKDVEPLFKYGKDALVDELGYDPDEDDD